MTGLIRVFGGFKCHLISSCSGLYLLFFVVVVALIKMMHVSPFLHQCIQLDAFIAFHTSQNM